MRRNDDPRNIHGARDVAGVHRTRAAETRENEIARISPAVCEHELDRLRHVFARNRDHRFGSFQRIEAKPIADLDEDPISGIRVQRELPTQSGVEPTEDEVGIGHGGLSTALSVARRARIRARALWADPQGASLVDPSDRSATCTDAADIEHGDGDRDFPFELVIMGDQPFTVVDDRGIEGGATHVGVDDVREFRRLAQIAGVGDTAGGPRFHKLLGSLDREVDAHHAAVALEREQRTVEAVVTQSTRQTVEIFCHDRK